MDYRTSTLPDDVERMPIERHFAVMNATVHDATAESLKLFQSRTTRSVLQFFVRFGGRTADHDVEGAVDGPAASFFRQYALIAINMSFTMEKELW